MVPGHEIVGKVVGVGSAVTKFAVGDMVGVGCMVDSCRSCQSCTDGLEQYCENGMTDTYASTEAETGKPTQGGYATAIVVNEHFVLRIPEGMDPASAAPLLCAGITTYSPLRHWKVGPGSRVAVVGIGGLGHMAVKIARALGAYVLVVTTSASKVNDAMRLGAHDVVVSRVPDATRPYANTIDVIIDTVGSPHDLRKELGLLKRDGTLVLLGGSPEPHEFPPVFHLIAKRRAIAGSLIGGIAETQDMLDFCAKHGITCDIELIRADQINEAYERMLRGDVRFRFVIDNGTLPEVAGGATAR
jgi:uncharacterized zinc-type alcohol dehydrogenase-like protein